MIIDLQQTRAWMSELCLLYLKSCSILGFPLRLIQIQNAVTSKLVPIIYIQVDKEVMILTSYETAMRTAHNFLAVFLAK